MPLTLIITKVPGGFTIEIPDLNRKAVATTARQAGKRCSELVEAALTDAEPS